MPVDKNLDFEFTSVQKDAIEQGLQDVLTVLNDASVPYVNLTKDERRKTPSIEAKRFPYAVEAVKSHLPAFPDLASDSIDLARTDRLLELAVFIQSLNPVVEEILDRFKDLEINAENIVLLSMNDSYEKAKRQEGRMPGADVLKATLEPLYADQGDEGGDDDTSPDEPTS